MEYSFPLQQLLRLLTEKTMLAYSKSKNQFQIVHNSSHCFDICQYHLTVLTEHSLHFHAAKNYSSLPL